MEFKNTKVSDELVPEGVSQLYQGHVVKSDAVGTGELEAQHVHRPRSSSSRNRPTAR